LPDPLDDQLLDERVRVIVERTLRDQGLPLRVEDPLALRLVASLVLTKDGRR
jgi:hypothetical protein